MLNAIKPSSQARGFTIVEIFVVLLAMSVIIMMGLPAFRAWIQNAQIRSVAESVLNGFQTARNEAVRRNATVEFIFNDPDNLDADKIWCVRVVSSNEDVQCKPMGEVSQNAIFNTMPGDATTVTFNGLGRIPGSPPNNRDGSAFLTRVDIDIAGANYDDKRRMSVSVTAGGQIRMCDLEITDNTDPRFCNYP